VAGARWTFGVASAAPALVAAGHRQLLGADRRGAVAGGDGCA